MGPSVVTGKEASGGLRREGTIHGNGIKTMTQYKTPKDTELLTQLCL